MICFQKSGVGVNDLFRNNSLSKAATLVLDSVAVSAVDDFGPSSLAALQLLMLDVSMSKSMRKPSEYRLAFTPASAMLLSTCCTISEVVSFDLIICRSISKSRCCISATTFLTSFRRFSNSLCCISATMLLTSFRKFSNSLGCISSTTFLTSLWSASGLWLCSDEETTTSPVTPTLKRLQHLRVIYLQEV